MASICGLSLKRNPRNLRMFASPVSGQKINPLMYTGSNVTFEQSEFGRKLNFG